MLLAALYDQKESEEVKAALLAWFCDELEDWEHRQVVFAIREWNRTNPRSRPSPGDLVAILKRKRGQSLAKRIHASMQAPEPTRQPMTAERAAEVAAELAEKFPGLGAMIKPMPRASE